MPDGTKPLPEPMLTYHQWGSVAFTKCMYQFHKITFHKMNLKNTLVKLFPHLPGGNELKGVQSTATFTGDSLVVSGLE